MTKEQLLKLVAEAYDDGARVEIKFHLNDNKAEADEIADQYADHFDKPCESYSNQGTGWHEYNSDYVRLIAFYKEEVKCANCQS